MKFVRGIQDIRTNNEDFVLTPFIGLVNAVHKPLGIYGLSLNWGYYSVYLALGFNLPKEYPTVTIKTRKRNTFADRNHKTN